MNLYKITAWSLWLAVPAQFSVFVHHVLKSFLEKSNIPSISYNKLPHLPIRGNSFEC